jgi:hypothetical protein
MLNGQETGPSKKEMTNKLQLGRDSAMSAYTSYFFELPCLNPRELKSSRAHRVQGRAD